MKYLVIGLLSLFLIGCNGTLVSTKSRDVYYPIPETLLEPCEANTPPSKASYMTATPREREGMLTNYSITLLGTIKTCNNQIDSIRIYNEKMKALINNEKTTQP